MKAIKLTDFRPNKRAIAAMWGTVNSTCKATERRASYFDCSGHGGYVCDPKDYTEKENEVMGEPNYALRLGIAVDSQGDEWVIAVEYEHSFRKQHRYDAWRFTFKEWRNYPMYVFEEDCNWAILTYATGIDLVELTSRFSKEERMKMVLDTINMYHPNLIKSEK